MRARKGIILVVDFKGARAKNAAHPAEIRVITRDESMIGKTMKPFNDNRNANVPAVRQRLDETTSRLKSNNGKNVGIQTEMESDIKTDDSSEEF